MFRIFFKNHVRLTINGTLSTMGLGEIKGDILVVAYGPRVGERSFKAAEAAAADEAVRR